MTDSAQHNIDAIHPAKPSCGTTRTLTRALLTALLLALTGGLWGGCSLVVENDLKDPGKGDAGLADAGDGDATTGPRVEHIENERGEMDPDYVVSGERITLHLRDLGQEGENLSFTVRIVDGRDITSGSDPLSSDETLEIQLPPGAPAGDVEFEVSLGSDSATTVIPLAHYLLALTEDKKLDLQAYTGEGRAVPLTEALAFCSADDFVSDVHIQPDGRWAVIGCIDDPEGQPTLHYQALNLHTLQLTDLTDATFAGLKLTAFTTKPGVEGFGTCKLPSESRWTLCRIRLNPADETKLLTEDILSGTAITNFLFDRGPVALSHDEAWLLVGVLPTNFVDWRFMVVPVAGPPQYFFVKQSQGGGLNQTVANPGVPTGVPGYPTHFFLSDMGSSEPNTPGLHTIAIDQGAGEAWIQNTTPTPNVVPWQEGFHPSQESLAFSTSKQPTDPARVLVWDVGNSSAHPTPSPEEKELSTPAFASYLATWTEKNSTPHLAVRALNVNSPQHTYFQEFWLFPIETGMEPMIQQPQNVQVGEDVRHLQADPNQRSTLFIATSNGIYWLDLNDPLGSPQLVGATSGVITKLTIQP